MFNIKQYHKKDTYHAERTAKLDTVLVNKIKWFSNTT